MNKKMKILGTCILVIGTLSIYSPINSPLLITKAYAEASTYSLAEDGELKSLDVQSTDGQSLELCDAYAGDQKSLTDSKEYYVLLDGKSDGVKIAADVQGDGYFAKVFYSDGDSAAPHDLGENLSVLAGQSTLYIRTYATEEDFKKAMKDKEASLCANTYKIKIQKATDDDTDEVSLDSLTLDSGKVPINFDRDTLNYNIQVNEDQDDVEIKLRAASDKDDIKIQDFEVEQKNDRYYIKDLHLLYGLNTIKIAVTGSEYRVRIYTLNITRGKSSSTSTLSNASQNTSSGQAKLNNDQLKFNQWVQINGGWKYNDSTGQTLKNSWFYDKNYGKYYYLKADGTMATNWICLNGSWYYLGQDGGMRTGWQDIDGKYYYLQSDGAMVKDTQIDGYKLGNDGAWIK